MAISDLGTRLVASLGTCPCCRADRREENRPADGIPDNCIYEAVYSCGAAVFVTTADEYEQGRACPGPLDLKLDALQDQVVECWELDADGRTASVGRAP